LKNSEETLYTYNTLRHLQSELQKYVVNVDYLINLVQGTKKYSQLKQIAKNEESLIDYYDVMAQKVSNYFNDKPAYLPEFLIICVLSHWILEEEKSITLFPFLNDINFERLIEAFENNRDAFVKDGVCVVSDIHAVSLSIVEKLKAKKYKINKLRVSKARDKKSKSRK
jgi:hypothetical protein